MPDIIRFSLTFSEKEFKHYENLALSKKRSWWQLLQADINKAFSGINVEEGEECVEGNKKRIIKTIEVPARVGRVIICLSKKLQIEPAALVYRLIISPHLMTIVKSKNLVVEFPPTD